MSAIWSFAVSCRNEVSAVNASTLRQVWSLIEDTQTNILLEVNDAELIQQLLRRLENQKLLSSEEMQVIRAYISSRLPLIRDLAMVRRGCTWVLGNWYKQIDQEQITSPFSVNIINHKSGVNWIRFGQPKSFS